MSRRDKMLVEFWINSVELRFASVASGFTLAMTACWRCLFVIARSAATKQTRKIDNEM
jgi:hypothetical protein